MKIHQITRRQLLGGIGATTLFARLGRMNALAQNGPSDYKALVCIFMLGGNDGHNTIVPLAQADFNAYKAARGSLALPDGNGPLHQVVTNNGGIPYGLNNGLGAIHPLWAQGKLGVMANVGLLVQPTTRTQYLANAVPVPTNLFSHSDQIQQMQSGLPGTGTGWGARVVDQVNAMNGASSFPASMSISGPALFCTGNIVQSASLLPGFNMAMSGMGLWPQSAADARFAGVQQVLQLDSGLAVIQAANKVRKDAIDLNAQLVNTTTTPMATVFPGTNLGQQLQQVAKLIKIRANVGMSRQVFFCSIGGFDTHGAQSWQHWNLLQTVSDAMRAFYDATVELGVPDKVTQFTLSDFGRTLQPSGTGCDHGWGNHQLILGGAVQGGRIYGAFPQMGLGGPDDSGNRGAMIPSTSIDQFGATLAAWFGVPAVQLPSVFPNITKFANTNLGFLG